MIVEEAVKLLRDRCDPTLRHTASNPDFSPSLLFSAKRPGRGQQSPVSGPSSGRRLYRGVPEAFVSRGSDVRHGNWADVSPAPVIDWDCG